MQQMVNPAVPVVETRPLGDIGKFSYFRSPDHKVFLVICRCPMKICVGPVMDDGKVGEGGPTWIDRGQVVDVLDKRYLPITGHAVPA